MTAYRMGVAGKLRERIDAADARLTAVQFAAAELADRMTRAAEYHARRGSTLSGSDVANILRDYREMAGDLRGGIGAARNLLREGRS